MVLPAATPSPAAEVFGALRAAVVRELDAPVVHDLLDQLAARGWRPRQLRERVGVLPVQPSSAQDAVVVTAELRRLLEERSPQEQYDAELARRAREREDSLRLLPTPAGPEERGRWIAAIRGSLRGSRVPVERRPQPRLRPACALCTGEGQFFVRRDVHLCSSCVDLLAAGAVSADRELAAKVG